MRAPRLFLLLAVAVVAPLVSVSLRATAGSPPAAPAASASVSSEVATASSASAAVAASAASASADGTASAFSFSSSLGAPRRRKVGERIASEPLPDKPTPLPPFKDWKGMEALDPDEGANACDLHLEGEWLQLYCGLGSIVDVSLLAGESGKDVALTLIEGEFGNNDGSAIVPLRRGRSFVVTMTSLQMGRYSSGLPETTALLFVRWRDDEATPTVRVEQ